MSNSRKETGKAGELLAAEFMAEKGFVILERNFRRGKGEIDLICKKGDLLVIVEVKTRSGTSFGYPEESVSESQAEAIIAVATEYMEEHNWDDRVRYDIISVEIGKKPRLHHFRDAFY